MTQFLASPLGRFLRFAVGVLLCLFGVYAQTPLGIAIAVIGLEPLFASIFDFSLFGALTGKPIRGVDVRNLQPPV